MGDIIVDQTVKCIPRVKSAVNFFINAIFVSTVPKHVNLATLLNYLLPVFYVVILSRILFKRHDYIPSFLTIYF